MKMYFFRLLLRPAGELEHLTDDFQAGGDLPGEERDVDAVQRDVQVARLLVALFHLWHQTSRHGPQHDDGRARVEVRTREELTHAQVRVYP